MIDNNPSLSEQLALSFDSSATPGIALRGQSPGQPDLLPYTWGLGLYPQHERIAAVLRDEDLPQGTTLSSFVENWDLARSSQFVGYKGTTERSVGVDDRQPFLRSYARRQWMFSIVGELASDAKVSLSLGESFDIAPVGNSVGEHLLSWIISQVRDRGCKTIEEFGWLEMHSLLKRVNEFGAASVLLTDGLDLMAYRDGRDRIPLHWTRKTPPHEETRLAGHSFLVDLDGPLDASRTVLCFSTLPMRGAKWTPLEPGELRIARRGACVWSSHPSRIEEYVYSYMGRSLPARDRPDVRPVSLTAQQQLAHADPDLPPQSQTVSTTANPVANESSMEAGLHTANPSHSVLSVVHETVYTYAEAVERSSHRFCLHPVHDQRQQVLSHDLDISVDGIRRSFEDVFGNRATILEVTQPFSEMRISSRATVRVENVLASNLKSPLRRDQIPLAWMPWQRQMMQAYLMPPELPEPELRELSEFGMSFVERNDYDLVETLLDLNRTIYRDFSYVTGSTSIETTPFQVYTARRGVCQDFANVLICVARLLGVPSRYRVGYIYTGGSYENKIQSDASHAWAEVYLPWMGWFGFDPTNGCLAGLDHVRIACGRHYRDAAPTAGTIYRGGSGESLFVDVQVNQLDDIWDRPRIA